MNIDIHSHFFPLDAFREAEKYGENAPKVTLEDGRLAVVSGGGKRGTSAKEPTTPRRESRNSIG